jgi:hypothetical protein
VYSRNFRCSHNAHCVLLRSKKWDEFELARQYVVVSHSTPLTLNEKSIRRYNWPLWSILLHSLYLSKFPLIPEEETCDIRASRVDDMGSRRSFQCAEIYPTAL